MRSPSTARAPAGRAVRRARRAVLQGVEAWLRRLHDEVRVTSVFVTHDQEAARSADRVVVMNHGRIDRSEPPISLRSPGDAVRPVEFLATQSTVVAPCAQRSGYARPHEIPRVDPAAERLACPSRA